MELTGFTKEGPFKFTFKHTGDLAREARNFRISDIPIMVTVRTDDASVVRGDVYIKLSLGINNDAVALLCQGYVSKLSNPSWPGGENEDANSGRGLIRVLTGTDPIAGADVVETVPANVLWRLISFIATLTTDANAADRRPRFIATNGTSTFVRIINLNNQTATQVRNYTFAIVPGTKHDDIDDDDKTTTIPDLLLPEGFTFETLTDNILAGDNWGAPIICVEQWLAP